MVDSFDNVLSREIVILPTAIAVWQTSLAVPGGLHCGFVAWVLPRSRPKILARRPSPLDRVRSGPGATDSAAIGTLDAGSRDSGELNGLGMLPLDCAVTCACASALACASAFVGLPNSLLQSINVVDAQSFGSFRLFSECRLDV